MFRNMFVKKEHRYRALLISLMAFVFLSPMLPKSLLGDIIVGGLFLLVIFSASFNLSTHLAAHWTLPLFGILTLIFQALVHYDVSFAIMYRVMMFLFFCTAIGVFGRDVFKETHPGIDHIFGAITIYFLIAITYATAYLFFQLINPQELIIGDTGLPVTNSFDLYYFSFITLSTVGYGDIIAQGQFAKIVCMFESMTGIFYIAILVASLQEIFQSSKG